MQSQYRALHQSALRGKNVLRRCLNIHIPEVGAENWKSLFANAGEVELR